MSQFTQELLELINQLRTSPSELTSQLQDFKQEFIQNYSYKTELIKELTKVTATLLKGSLGAVEENDKLNEVAEDLLNQLHNSKGTKLYAQDQEYIDVVMNMNFDGVTVSKNYLGNDGTVVGIYGGKNPYTLSLWTKEVTNKVHLDRDKKQIQFNIKVSNLQ